MPSVKLVWLALRDKPQNNTAFSPGRPGRPRTILSTERCVDYEYDYDYVNLAYLIFPRVLRRYGGNAK